jgi:hypothetical protein
MLLVLQYKNRNDNYRIFGADKNYLYDKKYILNPFKHQAKISNFLTLN